MKKSNFILVIFLSFTLLFIFKDNVSASNYYATENIEPEIYYNEDYSIKYNGIGSTFKLGNYTFDHITFDNNSNSKTIFLRGSITTDEDIDENKYYVLQIDYYNSNSIQIGTNTEELSLSKGTNSLGLIREYEELPFNPLDIRYYKLEFKIIDTRDEFEYTMSKDSSVSSEAQKNSAYYINRYDVNMVVNEDNTFDITETIDAYFNVLKHGIIRKLPLENTIARLDGTTNTNRVRISDVKVNAPFTKTKSIYELKLQIGDKDNTVAGSKEYVIKYKYDMGKDSLKDGDELYYNIIGTEWDTSISNITFTIKMPKNFDKSKLGFSEGTKDSTGNNKINYEVNGDTITGRYDGTLNPYEGITVRLSLPEGYFVRHGIDNFTPIIVIILPIVFLIISLILWNKYGKDEKIVETIEFYPPDGLNSLEVGFLYKGEASNEDVTSLLIYLANKGYIKIYNIDNIDELKIVKVKDYDGDDENEKIFMDGLFNGNKKRKNKDEVKIEDLEKLYISTRQILDNINTDENREKIMTKANPKLITLIVIMIIMTYIIITVLPMSGRTGFDNIIFSLITSSISFSYAFAMLVYNPDVKNDKAFYKLILAIVKTISLCAIFFGIFMWKDLVYPVIRGDSIYLIGYFTGLICIFGMITCIIYMPRRTHYGSEMLGKILGFRNFLETADKEKLEKLNSKDSEYLYEIIPYAYVLGISDKWFQKLEILNIDQPIWYSGTSTFNSSNLSTSINDSLLEINTTISDNMNSFSDSSSGSSSGGYSGSGSSGGGSGGGGGSSW